MDEKDYELLHALDETRNITHAADKLYMTQSALSKRIKALEQELGVEIVLRSRQGIRFTPAGEQVLLHSAAAAREMEKMRRQLASIQGEACGTLRAGISVHFSYYRLPEVLTEYHKAYPKVRLDIATGHSRNIYQQMLDSSLDVAVLRGEYPWDGTQFLLSQENICLICSEENKDRPISDYLYIDHSSDALAGRCCRKWRWITSKDMSSPAPSRTVSPSSGAPIFSARETQPPCRRCSSLWTCSKSTAERRKTWKRLFRWSRCWMHGSAGCSTSRSCWPSTTSRSSALP